MMEQRIKALLNQIPEWNGSSLSVTPIKGNLNNPGYRVDVGTQRLVLRLGNPHSTLLGINHEHEYICTSLAAELGIGPKIAYYLPVEEILITHWIEGKYLANDEFIEHEQTLQRSVQSIKRYHQGPAFPGTFSPYQTIHNYYRHALARGVHFSPQIAQAFHILSQVEQAIGPIQHTTPCHNDLLYHNLLDDGQQIRIIGWEYAAMGDLFFDLGNFAIHQGLSTSHCEQLLTTYFGEVSPRDRSHFYLMRMIAALKEAFWGFLQPGISTQEFDYRGYALYHLHRVLQTVELEEFSQWLQWIQLKV